MAMKSQRELVDSIISALQSFDPGSPEADDLAPYLYTVDQRLKSYIDDLLTLSSLGRLSKGQRGEAGKLMEQVALLSFGSLEGATILKSFQSAGPQHDLLVSGDGARWLTFCRYLNITDGRRSILVEAKATQGRLEDKQFARFCSVIDTNLSFVGLGVFFTLHGASGFPTPAQRQRAIRDCRLRQVLYHSKNDRAIVVFDREDLSRLGRNGSLPRMLSRKIRDISELGGLLTVPPEHAFERDLPDHLSSLL
jgi:hypothetical protein